MVQYNSRLICSEKPSNCIFRLAEYKQEKEFHHEKTMEHSLIFCQKGCMRITSNLFAEEILGEGEIIFLPRLNNYSGKVLCDTTLLIHEFNNTVCHPEHCILAYLYTHKRSQESSLFYHCKLVACESLITFFDTTILYIKDGQSNSSVWVIKHMELIWILTRYYSDKELYSFFHPMMDEQIPFKSLVLAHYRKANRSEELANLCGYGIYTFHRTFKKEFGISVHQWLIKKRAENIKYRLSQTFIPLTDIMDEFNFSSPQHFSHFCKKHLGDTPKSLRQKLTNSDKQ